MPEFKGYCWSCHLNVTTTYLPFAALTITHGMTEDDYMDSVRRCPKCRAKLHKQLPELVLTRL